MKNIVRKLTVNEQEKVTENHNLIYSFLHDRGLEIDEYYGLIAESLCKAVKSWDESKGNLSSYFYRIARNDLYRYWRRGNAQKRMGEEVKLEEEYLDLEYEYDLEEDVITKEIVGEILKSENGELFQMRLEGYSQQEIADTLGISRGTVSRRLSWIGENYFDRNG